jgi:ARG and Rhodanese-Phosphatase-superfamily-associated Protein domain
MDRSLFSLFGHGFLGFTALGVAALGFVWSGPGTPAGGAKPEDDWRLLEPITYENLTVFPVVSASGHDTREFLTLEEGLSSGEITVREQGAETIVRNRNQSRPVPPGYGAPSVNQLVLINRSKRPLILLAGELVSGGKQDRIIAKDRIVPPGAEPLPLNVFCVEHGRWSNGAEFSAASTIVHPSVREQAAVKQSQSDVWASVTAGSAAVSARPAAPEAAPRMSEDMIVQALRTEAPTQSYNKIYNSRAIGGSVDAFVEEVQRRFRRETSGLKGERVVGVVIAYGGEVAWSDIFASGELFEQYWNKLLRSYAVEALARPTLREKASIDDAREFLRRLNGRETTESEPGVYRWLEISEGSLSQIELDALQPKTITLHRLVLRRTS